MTGHTGEFDRSCLCRDAHILQVSEQAILQGLAGIKRTHLGYPGEPAETVCCIGMMTLHPNIIFVQVANTLLTTVLDPKLILLDMACRLPQLC